MVEIWHLMHFWYGHFSTIGKSLSIDALIKSLKSTIELNTNDLNINETKTIPFISHLHILDLLLNWELYISIIC